MHTDCVWISRTLPLKVTRLFKFNRVIYNDNNNKLTIYEDRLADIFFSYARNDIVKAEQLVTALNKKGWSVYWDSNLLAGQKFQEVIQQEIGKGRCMIVDG